MSASTDRPVAHTDGSCLGNPGPGGWGVHVEFPDGRVVELGGGELETTNNRMELRAAIEAVRRTKDAPAVTIVTDSQYVRRGITEWLAGWKRKGWVTVTGKPVENQALWSELDALTDDRITWLWTRGHSGDPGNERCDEIARWFAGSIHSLRKTEPPGDGRSRAAYNGSKSGGSKSGNAVGGTPGVHYLSLVDGILERHATWPDCQRRVSGVRAARFKKVRGPSEEAEVVAAWGLTPDDLYGV